MALAVTQVYQDSVAYQDSQALAGFLVSVDSADQAVSRVILDQVATLDSAEVRDIVVIPEFLVYQELVVSRVSQDSQVQVVTQDSADRQDIQEPAAILVQWERQDILAYQVSLDHQGLAVSREYQGFQDRAGIQGTLA